MRCALIGLAAVALAASACTASGGESSEEQQAKAFTPVPPAAVQLAGIDGLSSAPVTLGLVVTSASPRGEGAEDLALAAGARVAEFRAARAGSAPVRLMVVDDRGTAEGAAAAVEELLEARVSGIVYASQGAHLDAAVRSAAQAGTAVLLPYETRGEAVTVDGVWRTGPSGEQVAEEIAELLADRGLRRPYVLSGDGVGDDVRESVPASSRATLSAGSDLLSKAQAATDAIAAGRSDALVVAASAASQAETVAALQEFDATAPIVLGPEALSPNFPLRLANLSIGGGATTAGQYFTVGVPSHDSSTDDAMTAFLAALRLAAQDPGVKALQGTKTFSQQGAATAEVRSHDAVVALVRATVAAGSGDPAAVRAALSELQLDAGDGLAGPALDFRTAQALPDEGVVALQATTRVSDQRVGIEEAPLALTWFPLPDED